MKALVYRRSVPRYLLLRGLAPRLPGLATSALGCLRLGEIAPPALPGPDWLRIRPLLTGICGSDLATVTAQGSPYFSALTSFPFVPGHEVVGEVLETGQAVTGFAAGDRVVLEPALGCRVRGLEPPCRACANGDAAGCSELASGRIAAGVQTGYCRSTGGGFGQELVAHVSQVHRVPAELADEDAVLIEPFACAVHAVLRGGVEPADKVLVLGAGSVGLLTVIALACFAPGATVLVAAKHEHQRRLALALGAAETVAPGPRLRDRVVHWTGARRHRPSLGDEVVLGGVDKVFDCVGSSETVDEAIRLTRARGRVVVVGMPARLDGLEGTALWFQETEVVGAYAYGVERTAAGEARTFALALEAARKQPGTLARLLGHTFPLERWQDAFAAALATGRTRAVKVALDQRAYPGG